MLRLRLLTFIWVLTLSNGSCAAEPAHLFILSGQSNMARLDAGAQFIPMVEKAFGEDRVIVVKDAQGGEPIRRWYRDWTSSDGERPEVNGDLYDRLMDKVRARISGRHIETITFLWMQGENDAIAHGDVYRESLLGLLQQLRDDLGREDIHYVIGRLSDHGIGHDKFPDWSRIREIQMDIAGASPRGAWVDTDDLNDGINRRWRWVKDDLHYTILGYRRFGIRLAETAIELIRRNSL